MGKDSGRFMVTFGGDIETLNSDILIANLLSTTRIIQEINEHISSGKEQINISIAPFSKGSFEIGYTIIHLAFVTGFVKLIAGGGASYAKNIFDIFVDLHKIKNFLGGKKAQEVINHGAKVTIKDNHGTINIFNAPAFDLYRNNPTISENMNKSFRGLQKNEKIKNYQLKDHEDRPALTIERKEFNILYAPNEYIEENKRIKYDDNAKLIIFKIVWEQGYKWSFVYQERKISALITDEDFYSRIISSDSFREGDYFEARLKITQAFDYKINAFVDEDYEVTNIWHHIPSMHQQNIPYKS